MIATGPSARFGGTGDLAVTGPEGWLVTPFAQQPSQCSATRSDTDLACGMGQADADQEVADTAEDTPWRCRDGLFGRPGYRL